jgi:Fe2+ transport system protein FeoA
MFASMAPREAARPPAPATIAIPLTELGSGVAVCLHQILDPHARSLLRALGLTTASRLRLCQAGDPFIIQVRSTRIGLSRVVAQGILVTVESGEHR